MEVYRRTSISYSQNLPIWYLTKCSYSLCSHMIHRSTSKIGVIAMLIASVLVVSCSVAGPRGQKTEFTNAKTDITYFDAKAEMQVNTVTLDFFPESGKVITDPKKEGNQFVRVDLTFKNTGNEPFAMNYTNITMDTSNKEGVSQTFLINEGNVSDTLKSKELAAGETVTGAMYFEVPATETLSTMKVSYRGYDAASKEYKVPLAK